MRLGTKCPSMTSKWMKSAPASITRAVSEAKLLMSDASNEGPISALHLWATPANLAKLVISSRSYETREDFNVLRLVS